MQGDISDLDNSGVVLHPLVFDFVGSGHTAYLRELFLLHYK